MTNKDKDFWSTVIGIGVIGAGAFIGYKALKSMFRPEIEIWRCGNCHNILAKKYKICPYCGTKVKWNNPTFEGIPPESLKFKSKAFNIVLFFLIASFLVRVGCGFVSTVDPGLAPFSERVFLMLVGFIIGEPIGKASTFAATKPQQTEQRKE